MITYNLGKGTKSDCPSVLEAEATQAGHTLTHTGEIKGGDCGVHNEQGKHHEGFILTKGPFAFEVNRAIKCKHPRKTGPRENGQTVSHARTHRASTSR